MFPKVKSISTTTCGCSEASKFSSLDPPANMHVQIFVNTTKSTFTLAFEIQHKWIQTELKRKGKITLGGPDAQTVPISVQTTITPVNLQFSGGETLMKYFWWNRKEIECAFLVQKWCNWFFQVNLKDQLINCTSWMLRSSAYDYELWFWWMNLPKTVT